MENNEQKKEQESTLKKLASAQELRGKKAVGTTGTGKTSKKKMLISVIALVVVLGICIGIYIASNKIVPEVEEEEQKTSYTDTTVRLIERDRSEIDSVTVKNVNTKTFTVKNNVQYDEEGKAIAMPDGQMEYSIEGKEGFDLNQSTASAIIGYAANLTATKQITESAENLADFGLDKPSATVTMNYRDGSKEVWLVGSQAPTSSAYYFAKKGSKAVFLLYSSACTNLLSTIESLHNVTMPWTIADTANIRGFILETEGKDTLEVRYTTDGPSYSISALRIYQPFEYGAHTDRTDAIFTAMGSLGITGYAGEDDELTDCGLEGDAFKQRLTVIYDDDVNDAKDAVTFWYKIGNYSPDSEHIYVKIDDTGAVYYADPATLTFLSGATPTNLADQFSNLINIKKVDSMSIVSKDNSYEVSITRLPIPNEDGADSDKTNDIYYFDGEITDEKLFKKLYQSIIGTTNSKICEDYYYDGDVYCTVTYNLNSEDEPLVIEYLEYDNDYFAVKREGVTLFLIKRENIDKMLKDCEDYRNGTFVAE